MPKENRISKFLSRFTRVNEDVDPAIMAEGEIPSMIDMVLDNPFGKPHVRGGFQVRNSSTPAGTIHTYADVISKDGTNYQLVGHNTKISRTAGGAYTDVKTGLLGGRPSFRHTAFGDDIIITNGGNQPFRLSGDDLATTTSLEIVKPDVDSVIIQREKNILADAKLDFSSVYQYILIYITEIGERSNPSNPLTFIQAGATIPLSTNATLSRLYLDNLPVPTDDRVRSKWLFRTEGWDRASDTDGTIFYLLKKLDIDVIDYEDNIADEDLDLTEKIIYSRVPESAKYTVQSNNRIFFGNLSIHQKNFLEPFVVAKTNGGDQTPTTIVYEDGFVNSTGGETHLAPYSDVPYAGGGGGNGGLHSFRYYQYMYTYEDINGYETEPSYGEVFKTNDVVIGNYRDVVVNAFGVGGIGANEFKNNPNLKFRNIYRTRGEITTFTPNANTFYRVVQESIAHDEAPTGAFPNSSYDYFDDLADDAKDSGAGLGTAYAEVHRESKSAIAWSQSDRPAYFLAENIRQIFNDDQDEITGILDDGNGILIFKENSIIKLVHTGDPQNWYVRKIWDEHGCDNDESLVKAGNVIYFQYQKKPYQFISGSAPQYIGYGKQTFFDQSAITVNKVTANQDWVAWLCGDATDDYLIVWDTRTKAWYQFNLGAYATTFLSKRNYGSLKGRLVLGDDVTFDYNKADPNDEISGGSTGVFPSITLPRIMVGNNTPSKLRDIVLNFQRIGAGVVNLTLTTDATTHSAVGIPAGEGLLRVTGHGGKPPSNWFTLKFSGSIEQFDDIRVDLRPVRRGVGII